MCHDQDTVGASRCGHRVTSCAASQDLLLVLRTPPVMDCFPTDALSRLRMVRRARGSALRCAQLGFLATGSEKPARRHSCDWPRRILLSAATGVGAVTVGAFRQEQVLVGQTIRLDPLARGRSLSARRGRRDPRNGHRGLRPAVDLRPDPGRAARSRASRDPLRVAVIRPKRQTHLGPPDLMSSPTSRQVKLWGYTRFAASSTNVME